MRKLLLVLLTSLCFWSCDNTPEQDKFIGQLNDHPDEYFEQKTYPISSGTFKGCLVSILKMHWGNTILAIKCPNNTSTYASYSCGKNCKVDISVINE